MEGYEFGAIGNCCLLIGIALSWELLLEEMILSIYSPVHASARAGKAAALERRSICSIEHSAGNLNTPY